MSERIPPKSPQTGYCECRLCLLGFFRRRATSVQQDVLRACHKTRYKRATRRATSVQQDALRACNTTPYMRAIDTLCAQRRTTACENQALFTIRGSYQSLFTTRGSYQTLFTIRGSYKARFTIWGSYQAIFTIRGSYHVLVKIRGRYQIPFHHYRKHVIASAGFPCQVSHYSYLTDKSTRY